MPSRAQRLRAGPTTPEVRLWRLLFPFRTGGFHFRKQAQIGPFVVDFVCHHAGLVIEVDGDSHGTALAQVWDANCDDYLADRGYFVLRFSNDDVMHNPDGVYWRLQQELGDRPTIPRAL